jgi:hypothetical protein
MRSALASGHQTCARPTFTETSETHPVDTAARPIPALVDRVLVTYVEWRETHGRVAETYGRWSVAPAMEEAVRFAAYLTALAQGQTAAGVYAESISELERRLWGSDPGSVLSDIENGDDGDVEVGDEWW